ncbi:MAG: GIY-YIG nuclease family protein [Rickettsiales bacterium]|jgi:putative endonuclease|nr:GIY-YIG nuclease family protein [Rickettsiales bacterium]
MMKGGWTYILANKRNGTLYIGVSSDLCQRIAEHKEHYYPDSFTARHNVDKLVHYECFDRIEDAIAREKQLKDWNRNWKKDLVEKTNPEWDDLWNKFFETGEIRYEYNPEDKNIKMMKTELDYDPDNRLFRKIFKGVPKK